MLMEGIARLVAEMHPAIRIDVVEGGGVMNHSLVGSGEVDLGILNPPMTAAAVEGRDPYDRTYPDLRAGVANLTVNHLHLLVEADSPLQAMDLMMRPRGKEEGRSPSRSAWKAQGLKHHSGATLRA